MIAPRKLRRPVGREKEPIAVNLRNSPVIRAGVAGLLFALVYVGLEILTQNPQATNSISVWHFPVIWLLAGVLFYCVSHALAIARSGRVRERAIPFGLSLLVAVLLALFWLVPMLAGLLQCFGGTGC
jgi:hypothetical protein